MIKSTVIVKPKTRSQSHQPLPVFATRKLAGFADKACFVDSSQSQTRDTLGTEIGTRYRYIDDTPLVPLSEATADGAKTRSRASSEYVLYSYGEPVAMTNDSGTSYFGTDILGSIRNVTDKYGAVQSNYDYDVFGSPYLNNLENEIGFGYCSKIYDIGTGLYDYGFRDYSPVSARFTTIDPIRDGTNWFSYVVNDPVNYVDPFGLKCKSASDNEKKFNPFDITKPDIFSALKWGIIKVPNENNTETRTVVTKNVMKSKKGIVDNSSYELYLNYRHDVKKIDAVIILYKFPCSVELSVTYSDSKGNIVNDKGEPTPQYNGNNSMPYLGPQSFMIYNLPEGAQLIQTTAEYTLIHRDETEGTVKEFLEINGDANVQK